MQGAPPPKSEVDRLVSEFREAAGAETFRWIAAAAVYPELRWPMTLYLRDRVGGRVGQPATLGADMLGGCAAALVPSRLDARLGAYAADQEAFPYPERRQVRSTLSKAMGIAAATQPAPTAMELSARERAAELPKERVRADRILVDYLLPSLASANQFFALPDEWARKIARRPLGRLAIAAICGAAFAAAGSFVALSLMPIEECDLWGTSPFQTDAVGPPRPSTFLDRGGYVERVIGACKAALAKKPDNIRLRYEYLQALTSKINLSPDEIQFSRNTPSNWNDSTTYQQ